MPAGWLGDAHGRKWLFIGGLSLFAAASVVGGTATEAWVVALARLLQGAGAGTVNPQIFGLIQELFTGRERTRALAAYATVGGISGVIGPLVGGTVIGAVGEQHGWRWVVLNVPFALLTVPLALKWLPTTARRAGRRTTLDLVGPGLLATVTVGVLLPFVLGMWLWPLLTASVALLALLAWEPRYARSGRTPILLPALLESRSFTLGTLTAMFQFGATMAASLALTLAHAPRSAAGLAGGFLQVSQRISATIVTAAVAGVVLTGIAAGESRASVVQGLLICVGMVALSTIFAALDVRGTPQRESLRQLTHNGQSANLSSETTVSQILACEENCAHRRTGRHGGDRPPAGDRRT